jgi:hypothetical protein
MGPIGCPETSVQNYQSTLRNIPQERRYQVDEYADQGCFIYCLQKLKEMREKGLITWCVCEDLDAALQAPESLQSSDGSSPNTETAYRTTLTLTVVTAARFFKILGQLWLKRGWLDWLLSIKDEVAFTVD